MSLADRANAYLVDIRGLPIQELEEELLVEGSMIMSALLEYFIFAESHPLSELATVNDQYPGEEKALTVLDSWYCLHFDKLEELFGWLRREWAGGYVKNAIIKRDFLFLEFEQC